MDDSLYDEFGNYLGPELSSSEEEEDEKNEMIQEPLDTMDVDQEEDQALIPMSGKYKDVFSIL
jgi:U5 small nuclear ribonucleoprotein component